MFIKTPQSKEAADKTTPGFNSNYTVYFVLVSRLVLFLLFQGIIALLSGSWSLSERYWLLSAILTNFTGIVILWNLFRKEDVRFLSIFRFHRDSFRKDLLIFIMLTLVAGPIVFLPGNLLAGLIWDDPSIPTMLLFRETEPFLNYFLLLLFPATIALSELATYFVYVMPRLRRRLKRAWPALLLPVVFLSLQHATLPFIPDLRFIIYRSLMFLPFALLLGISLWKRPSLFPYFAILHGIMDAGTALMFILDLGQMG